MNKVDRDSFNYRFGQNLARIRNNTGLSQAEMETFGISRAYYGRVELGLHSISVEKLNEVSKAFGVPLTELFIDKNGDAI